MVLLGVSQTLVFPIMVGYMSLSKKREITVNNSDI
jgi:hypothetical protein